LILLIHADGYYLGRHQDLGLPADPSERQGVAAGNVILLLIGLWLLLTFVERISKKANK